MLLEQLSDPLGLYADLISRDPRCAKIAVRLPAVVDHLGAAVNPFCFREMIAPGQLLIANCRLGR
jgi:hypothetical protein